MVLFVLIRPIRDSIILTLKTCKLGDDFAEVDQGCHCRKGIALDCITCSRSSVDAFDSRRESKRCQEGVLVTATGGSVGRFKLTDSDAESYSEKSVLFRRVSRPDEFWNSSMLIGDVDPMA